MSQLKDYWVANYDIYFECAKEQVSLFYPTLDLSMLAIFNVIFYGQLVDSEDIPF